MGKTATEWLIIIYALAEKVGRNNKANQREKLPAKLLDDTQPGGYYYKTYWSDQNGSLATVVSCNSQFLCTTTLPLLL